MPETNGNENPVFQTARKRSERTEAKFFEDVEKIIAEAERLDAQYQPPNRIATLSNPKAKRAAALAIPTSEEMYKASPHRAKLAALQQANNAVITAESNSNTSGEALDKLAYTDDDSLLNACISAKGYIKSKFKTTGQPYKNIAKTRFVLPSRLRKKK